MTDEPSSELTAWDICLVLGGIGIGIILALVCLPCPASALLVSDIIITPNTTAMVGAPVSASYSVDLTPYDRYTMNPENSLKFTSGLDNPTWTTTFTLNAVKGTKIPQTGNSFTLPGWQLVYPLGVSEHISGTISGKAPNISSSKSVTIFEISECNSAGMVIPGTTSAFTILVINSGDISFIVKQEESDLRDLKADIAAAKENPGEYGSSTAAQALYQQAATGIDYLKTLKPEEYPSAVQRAREIDAAIQGAEDMLNREGVQTAINRAIKPINQTAMILGWFAKDNRTANYGGLSNITEQYQRSSLLLTSASIGMNNAQWVTARANAEMAYIVGNQTLNAAITLQRRASDPLTPLWENTWIVYVVIGAGVVYFLFFRKKKRKVKKLDNSPARQEQNEQPKQTGGLEPDTPTSAYESSTATEDEPMTEADCIDCEKDCPELVKTRRQLSRVPCQEKVKKSDHSNEEVNMLYDSVR